MFPKISCYNDTCWFVHDVRFGEHIAKVVQKDEELEAECDSNIYYHLIPAEKYDVLKHHYWVYVSEWNMYRCNISANDRIQK